MLPNICKLLVNFEKWDFPDTNIKQVVWRVYLIKFISLATIVITSFEGLLIDYSFLDDLMGTNFKSRIGGEADEFGNTCRYDKSGLFLISLAINEMIVLGAA